MPRRWKIFLLVASVALLADQASKLWARDALDDGPVSVVSGYWDWHLSMNPGASFNLFHGVASARIFLSILGVVAVGFIVYMVKKSRDDQRAHAWALGLIAGGAVGNLVDRIAHGVVTDFARFHWGEAWSWPIFNVADVALVAGVALLVLDAIRTTMAARRQAH
jgi:signal peptidase II